MKREAVLAFLAGVTLTVGAVAQRPHRSGLWFETAGGPSRVRIACSGCGGVINESGSGGYFRIGGSLSSHVLLGVESFNFIDKTFGLGQGDTSEVAETATLTAVVLWFPGRSGLFLKGGMGFGGGRYTVQTSPTQADTAEGLGIGMTFGAGYDVPITRKFAITAQAAVHISGIGDIVLPAVGGRVDDVIATMYHFSIGLTIR